MSDEKKQPDKSIIEKTGEAIANIRDDAAKIEDISAGNDAIVKASSSGELLKIRPCSISEIPALVKLLTKMDEGFEKFNNDAAAAIVDEKQEVLTVMSEIILMGLKKEYPDMTVDKVKEKFAITDFPYVYEHILDMNDFLAGMRKITQMK
jgi:hypothetical protein